MRRHLYNQPLLYYMVLVALILLFLLLFAYGAGLSRGRLQQLGAQLTREAALPTATPTLTPTWTHTPITPSPTVTDTPTNTSTPTHTPTPTHTATPTNTPTFTPTPTLPPPGSPQEWALRYQALAVEGLNTIAAVDLSAEANSERVVELLRRIAQEQGMIFVPVSFFQLTGDSWAAFVVPRTPAGEALPILFWREPNDRNRIRSQILVDLLSAREQGIDYRYFSTGIDVGLLRTDELGRFQIVLIERTGTNSLLSIYHLSQSQPAGDFELIWRSQDDPTWAVRANDSSYQLRERESSLLPDIEIISSISASSTIRQSINAPAIFVERPPFARQLVEMRWAATVDSEQKATYRLQNATLPSTPLTALSRLLNLLQNNNVNEAGNFATRFDLLQEAFDLGLGAIGTWVAFYVDDSNQVILNNGDEESNTITNRLRFFDNADRNRTYDAIFELDEVGDYRVAAIELTTAYNETALVTPLPPGAEIGILDEPEPTLPPTATPVPVTATATTVAADSSSAGQAESGLVPTFTPTVLTSPTVPPTETTIPSETPTSTATLTPAPTVTQTSTHTPSATPTDRPTETPTETATATATGTPLPIPDIPGEQAAIVRGLVYRVPANLRGGPNTGYISLAQLEYGIPVELFGMTEDGQWFLVRITTGDGRSGTIGWIFAQLVQYEGDLNSLPKHFADGLPVVPYTPTPSPTAGPPTATPTFTPRPTPFIEQPVAAGLAENGALPAPESGEIIATISGNRIPASPLSLVPATGSDGRWLQLRVEAAEILMWRGLLNGDGTAGDSNGWVSAPAELLWPDTHIYISGTSAPDNNDLITVSRVRIVRAPQKNRATVLSFPDLSAAFTAQSMTGLLGSREETGVHLLNSEGSLQQLWVSEHEANWIHVNPSKGMILHSPEQPHGRNSFNWVRSDGSGLQIFAQPFYNLSGVVGDTDGSLWWIETPQADSGQWQLWHYDPFLKEISPIYQATGALFKVANRADNASLVPILLQAHPDRPDEPTQITLIVDTLDGARQQPNAGVFQLVVRIAGGQGTVTDTPQLYLAPDSYRGPLRISPDQSLLAYFVYDSGHPSLTSGFIQPANRLKILPLIGDDAGVSQTVYETENRFEFLAPDLAWQGDKNLVLARSRFTPGEVFGVERFGLVQVELNRQNGALGESTIRQHMLSSPNILQDFTPCLDGKYTLMISADGQGNAQLSRWDGTERPWPLFILPAKMNRAFICVQGE